MGTTSACAENTVRGLGPKTVQRNYLRMRGEYAAAGIPTTGGQELPPHARRIRCLACRSTLQIGTTSACAENTHHRSWRKPQPRNYLRARGEYFRLYMVIVRFPELPPRARRIQSFGVLTTRRSGTTSACAENTQRWLAICRECRNYLRVRGEYMVRKTERKTIMELPPRARRIPNLSGGAV